MNLFLTYCSLPCPPHQIYELSGPLFFGSVRPLLRVFDYDTDPDLLVVDLDAKNSILDFSGLTALNEVGIQSTSNRKT